MKNLYIAGLPRGGTSLLSQVIGCAEETLLMGETMYIGHKTNESRLCSCGSSNCKVTEDRLRGLKKIPNITDWNYVYGVLDSFFEPNKCPSGDTIRYSVPESFDMAEFIDRGVNGVKMIADFYRDEIGSGHLLVDASKEIHVGRELARTDGWKVILITRDIRGTAYSVLSAGVRKGVDRKIEDKIQVWREFASQAQAMIDEGAFHIRYEDLCNDSKRTIGEISDYLRIEINNLCWCPEKHHVLYGNRAMRKRGELQMDCDERWKKCLDANTNRLLVTELSDYGFLFS